MQAPQAPVALVEIIDRSDLRKYAAPWRALCSRAAEANCFGDPDFLIPALEHLAPSGVALAFIWSDEARTRLIGAIALKLPRFRFGAARVWRSEQAGLPALIIDAAHIEATLAPLFDFLRRRAATILIPGLPRQGDTAQAVERFARDQTLPISVGALAQRAALAPSAHGSIDAAIGKKRLKEWARLRRRLSETGALACQASAALENIDDFLRLESSGWKGRRGTGLAGEKSREAFARAMIAAFVKSGALEFHRLDLDGRAIAMGILIRAHDRAFFWKIAYDESLSAFSPGVLLTLDLSRRLERTPGLALVDSCAISNHPMIDRIWSARLELADFMLATHSSGAMALSITAKAAQTKARLRAAAKTLLGPMLGRKRS